MRLLILIILLVLVVGEPAFTDPGQQGVSLPPNSATADEAGQQQRLDEAYDKLVQAGFTGFVAISVGERTVYTRGNASDRRTFGLDTPIDILSMTKSLTGAAIGRLLAEGKLRPETRIGEIFPEAPEAKGNITVHQLLTHASGLPQALGEDQEYLDRDAYLTRAWKTPLIAEPGSRYEYSNVGYSVLAAIIEQVAGQSFEAYLRENIIVPAGMTSTGYDRACCAIDGMSVIASRSWGGPKPSWHLIGNGGMLSTPRDMMRWITASESDGAPWSDIRVLTHQPYQREGENASSHYGYGLVVEDHPKFGRLYWHNGGSRSYNGHWRYYADHGVSIFVTSDQWKVDPDTAERTMAEAFF